MTARWTTAQREQIDELARVVWDFHRLGHELRPAECIVVLGSHDVRVAGYAARLYLEGWAPLLVFSGGYGALTRGLFSEPEADVFARIALDLGVPGERILVESRSTNTGENVVFTRRLLARRGVDPQSLLSVQIPYMERRALATFGKQWPGPEVVVSSPPIAFEDYPTSELPRDLVINVMVGDLQRIRLYAQRGYQIEQEIPRPVWEAYERLVDLGYTDHLTE